MLDGLSLKLLCPNTELLSRNISIGAQHHLSHSLREPQEKLSVHEILSPKNPRQQAKVLSASRRRQGQAEDYL